MRWKAQVYGNGGLNTPNLLNYIFKSRKCPPQHKYLTKFENDLLELIKSVKFKEVKNKSSDQLHKDILINETDKNTYSKLLTDNISKTYKKTEHNIYNKINKESKMSHKARETREHVLDEACESGEFAGHEARRADMAREHVRHKACEARDHVGHKTSRAREHVVHETHEE